MRFLTTARRRTAALAVTALVAGAGLAGCGSEDSPGADDRADDTSDESAPASETPSDEGSPSDDADEGNGTAVPVYYVGDTPQGPRLYREFHRTDDDPLDAAVDQLVTGTPTDPDYRSPFPTGGEVDVEAADGQIRVELDDAAWAERPDGMSAREAKLALQALVYTAQGAAQSRDDVTVVVDDAPSTLFGVAADGVGPANELRTLALVNVTTPEEGGTVGGTITAEGVASSFEATVPWEVRQGDEVVETGFATAEGWIDGLYPWETEVDLSDLEPGEYTFVAMTDDPSGGEGGGPTEDTKTIVVE